MIKTIIIDSHKADLEILKTELIKIDSVEITAEYSGISSAFHRFNKQLPPNLIICEIPQNEPSANELIEKYDLRCPFIYSSESKEALNFQLKNVISFIQKPFSNEVIINSVKGYLRIQDYFFREFINPLKTKPDPNPQRKKRIIVKKGHENIVLNINEVACFNNQNRLTFVFDLKGNKYFIDDSLIKIQNTFQCTSFFRASRNFLINIEAIKKFKPFEKGKLELFLLPETNERIIISQPNSIEFKKWIESL